MGHVISRDGLKPEDDKVTAIKNMLKLTTRPEVLTLLVFVNYLSKFLPKLSDVSASLRELTTDHSKFTCMMKLLPLFSAWLFNTRSLNSTPSRPELSPTEQRYATIEKECLGIVFACERFNQYLARSFQRLQSSHPSVTET